VSGGSGGGAAAAGQLPGARAVRAYAPGSVSNVGPGFDVFGFALEAPGDVVTAEASERAGVELVAVSGDGGRLPREAARNTAAVAAQAVLAAARRQDRARGEDSPARGVRLWVEKRMPLASGLGSSAASAVAAVVAVDAAWQLGLPRQTLLACALAGERSGCGAAHADNVAPSLWGGFVLVRGAGAAAGLGGAEAERSTSAGPSAAPAGGSPLGPLGGPGAASDDAGEALLAGLPEVDVVALPVPAGLTCALVRPHVAVETGAARALLGDQVPLAAATAQWGNAAGLVAALYAGDLALLARCLVDLVAEPKRAPLVPGFAAAVAAARAAGALGAGLSGSGPSIFALCADAATAPAVVTAMRAALRAHGVEADGHLSPVGAAAARLLAAGEMPGSTAGGAP
jgi:homoserine kinase